MNQFETFHRAVLFFKRNTAKGGLCQQQQQQQHLFFSYMRQFTVFDFTRR